jgi:hypothetical protein
VSDAAAKRFVVAQVPAGTRSSWRHYLCGWCSSGNGPPSGWHATRDAMHHVPVFMGDRAQALRFDEPAARLLADQLNDRYRNVVRNYAEEVPA